MAAWLKALTNVVHYNCCRDSSNEINITLINFANSTVTRRKENAFCREAV